jgi:hypothetical protein
MNVNLKKLVTVAVLASFITGCTCQYVKHVEVDAVSGVPVERIVKECHADGDKIALGIAAVAAGVLVGAAAASGPRYYAPHYYHPYW